MTVVHALVLVAYSALAQEVTRTKIMSFHKNHFSCVQTMNKERFRGRRLQFNENYVCLQLQDSHIGSQLLRMGGNDRIVIHGTKRFFNKPKRDRWYQKRKWDR